MKIKIQPVAAGPKRLAAGVRQCLQVDLDGGGAAVFSPPVEVGSSYSYVLEGSMRTEGLEQDRAFLSVTFLDAETSILWLPLRVKRRPHTRGWKRISLRADRPSQPGNEIGCHWFAR